jgi:hypothetical protein
MADETVSELAQVNLAGTITARSAARVLIIPVPFLFGRITVRSRAGGIMPPYLNGRITARGQIHGQFPPYLIARVTVRSAGRALPLVFNTPPNELRLLSGRVTASSRIGLQPPRFTTVFSGHIAAKSSAWMLNPIFVTRPIVQLTGRIIAATKLRLHTAKLSPDPLSLTGRITGRSQTRLGTGPYYVARLAGRIGGRGQIFGRAGPWLPYLVGRITAQTRGTFAVAEIAEPLPPYPPPFPTFTTLDYLNRITSEHNQRPRYMATVGMSVDPMVADQQLVAGVPGLFDLDYSIGQQEDFTGQWIGKSRWIELPAVYFSWDEEGLGWNQANWKGPMDADNALQRLDDYHYRLLLYATVIANHWNGSIPAAYEAWDTLFQYTGLKVVIQDYGNMTMLYGLLSESAPDIVLLSLFTTGQMDLRPEGIELRAYALQPTPGKPFFAWDATSSSVQGWDSGYWGLMLAPGEGYIPGVGTVWDTGMRRTTRTDDQTIWDDGNTVWDRK